MILPWHIWPLSEWAIVGMNHYRKDGRRYLFVTMTWEGLYIRAEGPDEVGQGLEVVFACLHKQAEAIAAAERAPTPASDPAANTPGPVPHAPAC